MNHQPGEDQDELDAVEIRDNGESLVDFLAACPDLLFAPRHPVFEFPRVHLLRESVARMVCEAAQHLKAVRPDLRLQIVEGYRPLATQRAMFRHANAEVRKLHPDWDAKRIAIQAGRFSAPPEAVTPPPHITGGAVDLELATPDGVRLDFSSPFDILDLQQAAPDAPGLSDEANANRALLKSILEPTGLTSYVDEWWHWSYGDNGWALRVRAPHALYDKIEMPADAHWVGDLKQLPQ